jgi:hypothetical protein
MKIARAIQILSQKTHFIAGKSPLGRNFVDIISKSDTLSRRKTEERQTLKAQKQSRI